MRQQIRATAVALFTMTALLGTSAAAAADSEDNSNDLVGAPIAICGGSTTNIANPGSGGSISDCYLHNS